MKKKMVKMREKKGQIAIWVIIAIVFVATIMLFFVFERGPAEVAEVRFGPEQYIQKCISPAIEDAVENMIPQGGLLEPKSFKEYNRTKVAYLCKTDGFYGPCINIHPMLLNEIKADIKNYISPVVESCFTSMKEELEKENQIVKLEQAPTNFSVSLAPSRVLIDINKDVEITEKEITRTFEEFDVEIASPIYELANLAMNIADHERKYCYFEYVGYMAIDKNVDIRKVALSDSTKIYTFTNKRFGKTMSIATRSCAIPAGGL